MKKLMSALLAVAMLLGCMFAFASCNKEPAVSSTDSMTLNVGA